MKTAISIASLIVLVALSGCASVKINQMGRIDKSEKTIFVPAGSAGLTGSIKGALAKDGWQMVVPSGQTVTDGEMGPRVHLKTQDASLARYKLALGWEQFDVRLIDFDPMYRFDISIVDRRNGVEVITASGKHAGKVITQKFLEALRE